MLTDAQTPFLGTPLVPLGASVSVKHLRRPRDIMLVKNTQLGHLSFVRVMCLGGLRRGSEHSEIAARGATVAICALRDGSLL